MSEVVDYASRIIEENPMLYIVVGSVIDDGVAKEHYSCVGSTNMNKLDPEKECYRVIATALKGVISFLQESLGNKEHASEVFTAGLLEALSQTSTGMLRMNTPEDDEFGKYRFKRMKD